MITYKEVALFLPKSRYLSKTSVYGQSFLFEPAFKKFIETLASELTVIGFKRPVPFFYVLEKQASDNIADIIPSDQSRMNAVVISASVFTPKDSSDNHYPVYYIEAISDVEVGIDSLRKNYFVLTTQSVKSYLDKCK